ncbi:hypothetical protein C8Q74DRAFT_714120 [Fomes fomentarius]|nr:hypothetical protein C8Q74DRAFT_714120 [Fomes fomentarius]
MDNSNHGYPEQDYNLGDLSSWATWLLTDTGSNNGPSYVSADIAGHETTYDSHQVDHPSTSSVTVEDIARLFPSLYEPWPDDNLMTYPESTYHASDTNTAYGDIPYPETSHIDVPHANMMSRSESSIPLPPVPSHSAYPGSWYIPSTYNLPASSDINYLLPSVANPSHADYYYQPEPSAPIPPPSSESFEQIYPNPFIPIEAPTSLQALPSFGLSPSSRHVLPSPPVCGRKRPRDPLEAPASSSGPVDRTSKKRRATGPVRPVIQSAHQASPLAGPSRPRVQGPRSSTSSPDAEGPAVVHTSFPDARSHEQVVQAMPSNPILPQRTDNPEIKREGQADATSTSTAAVASTSTHPASQYHADLPQYIQATGFPPDPSSLAPPFYAELRQIASDNARLEPTAALRVPSAPSKSRKGKERAVEPTSTPDPRSHPTPELKSTRRIKTTPSNDAGGKKRYLCPFNPVIEYSALTGVGSKRAKANERNKAEGKENMPPHATARTGHALPSSSAMTEPDPSQVCNEHFSRPADVDRHLVYQHIPGLGLECGCRNSSGTRTITGRSDGQIH